MAAAGVVAATCLALATVSAGAEPQPSSPLASGGAEAVRGVPNIAFGMNEDWLRFRFAAHPLSDLGAELIRFPFPWREIRPNKRKWDWTKMDQLHVEAATAGAGFVLMPQDAPCFARPSQPCRGDGGRPPDAKYMGEYRKLLKRALKRYGSSIVAVEAWNEPNLTNFFHPRPNPKRYFRLLRATWRAVRAVDPEVPVLFGGLATGHKTTKNGKRIAFLPFLKRVHKLGGKKYYDILSLHSFDALPKMQQTIARARKELTRVRKANRPIWMTEVGISTSEAGGPEAQADRLAEVIQALKATEGVKGIVIHRMYDVGSKRHDDMGLLTAEGERKPAFCVVAAELGTGCPD